MYIPTFKLFGFIPVQPFGILVAIAMITGFQLGRRRARMTGLDPDICADGMVWMAVAGFALAHIVSELLYYPGEVVKNPLTLFAFWRGLSSFGGLMGATLAAFIYFGRKEVSFMEYGEAILFGFVPAWIIGRMGCTIVFDHPGFPTNFMLGMADLSGVVRHNLGMYEMLLAASLTTLLYTLKNHRPFFGFHVGVMMLLYGPARFALDYLRISDKKYMGLTPGQYFSAAMIILGTYILIKGYSRRSNN